MRGEQDERLAAISQQACNRAALVSPRSDGTERQLVVSEVSGGVETADEVAIEGILHPEHDPDQPAARSAQHLGATVRAIPQFVGHPPDPFTGGGTGPGRVAHDHRYKRGGHAHVSGHVGQRGATTRGCTRRLNHLARVPQLLQR